MEALSGLLSFFLHIDKHLVELVNNYGTTSYVILFLIIFAETGLVVTPFLPGDSLLFAIGGMCALGALDLNTTIILLIIAAILGDAVNYSIGKFLGPQFAQKGRFLKKEYLDKTHEFYEKHGGKTIIFARFVPIIRTFAPFVAGMGKMTYSKFGIYNVVGAIVWILSFTVLGYNFSQTEVVKKNFTLFILGIIVVSLVPTLIEIARNIRKTKAD